MKKLLTLTLIISILFSLCSCGKYTSSYRAIGLVRTQSSHSCETSFYSLTGRLVFKLKGSNAGKEGDISYSIRVDRGELYLYYDIYGTKEELAHVSAGEELEGRGGYIEGGRAVYIIIETADGTGGRVSAELDS